MVIVQKSWWINNSYGGSITIQPNFSLSKESFISGNHPVCKRLPSNSGFFASAAISNNGDTLNHKQHLPILPLLPIYYFLRENKSWGDNNSSLQTPQLLCSLMACMGKFPRHCQPLDCVPSVQWLKYLGMIVYILINISCAYNHQLIPQYLFNYLINSEYYLSIVYASYPPVWWP